MSIINNVNRIVDIIVVLSMSLGEAFKRALFDKIEDCLLVKRHIRSC